MSFKVFSKPNKKPLKNQRISLDFGCMSATEFSATDLSMQKTYQPIELQQQRFAQNLSQSSTSKKYFGATPEPLVFAQFVAGLDDKLYDQFPSQEALAQRLAEGLREYNDMNAVMDLVLFDDAMKHVCKVSRIIAADSGHALLVGVGGSGK